MLLQHRFRHRLPSFRFALPFAGAVEALRGAFSLAGVIVAAIALGRSSQP
jgi:hypothetical protein